MLQGECPAELEPEDRNTPVREPVLCISFQLLVQHAGYCPAIVVLSCISQVFEVVAEISVQGGSQSASQG